MVRLVHLPATMIAGTAWSEAERSESEEGEDVKDREATSFSWQAVNRTKQREQRDRPNHV